MELKTYYLAVDIGAFSGRHMLSWIENGKICLEEIYRFENGMVEKNGHLCWNIERLFCEIVNGLAVCKKTRKIPISMGFLYGGTYAGIIGTFDKRTIIELISGV